LWFLRRQWELPRVSCTLAAAGNYPVVFPQSHQHYTEIQPEFDLEGLPTLKGVKTPPCVFHLRCQFCYQKAGPLASMPIHT
jgi:hypothetical protein